MKKKKTTYIALLIAAVVLFLAGAGCLLAKALSTEWVDTAGILHESFFLLPLGFAGIILGVLTAVVWLVLFLISRKRKCSEV